MIREALRAGTVAAVLSGAPSTAWALIAGDDVLEPSLAAGSMLLPSTRRRVPLLAAATAAHAVLSLGWAQALALVPVWQVRTTARGALRGAVGGLAIAAVDFGLAHASHSLRFARVRALPLLPQLADHVAYGAVVGAVLARPLSRA
ncbi:MAG: hypothetical protein ABI808_04725 [Pseudonocardiales bacterium]